MMGYFDPPSGPCCVCDEAITDLHYAECSVCARAFHLRMTETVRDKKDCGTVEINDENWGMMFTCQTCWDEEHANDQPFPLGRV